MLYVQKSNSYIDHYKYLQFIVSNSMNFYHYTKNIILKFGNKFYTYKNYIFYHNGWQEKKFIYSEIQMVHTAFFLTFYERERGMI